MTQPSRIAAQTAVVICQALEPYVSQGPTLEGSADFEEGAVVKYGDIQLVILGDGTPVGGQEAVEAFRAAVNELFRPQPSTITAFIAYNLYEMGARGQAVWADPKSLGDYIDKAEVDLVFRRMIPGTRIVPEPEEA